MADFIRIYKTYSFKAIVSGISLLLIVYFCWACSGKAPEPVSEKVLARVGDKVITVNEFIERAEYTIRPPYCNSNNYIHRKIVLNSLIAEKLLAIEAGDNNELTSNEHFQAYLRGRQEQAMRQVMFHEEGYLKADVDSQEIKRTYRLAGRKYNISFFRINHPERAGEISRHIGKPGFTFEDAYQLSGAATTIESREVEFKKHESDIILDALYSDSLKKGQIVGPLLTETGEILLLRIDGWTNRVAMTNNDIRDRWTGVSDFIRKKKAQKIYEEYVGKLMEGKSIEFFPNTFMQIVNIVGPFYLKSDEEKRDAFNQMYWDKENPQTTQDSIRSRLDSMREMPFFKIDGEVWTVGQFEKQLKVHPLVFRKTRFARREFAEQFKLAVVDMIRDKYITEDAYRKNYHQTEAVQRYMAVWKDHLQAMYQKHKYLKSLDCREENPLVVIDVYLNPYIRELQKRYNDVIEINTDEFEQIQLTRIDMFVVQRNVPFPVATPDFPQLTTLNKLDYGRKMPSSVNDNREQTSLQ